MKMKLKFTAEIIEEFDVQATKIYTEEQNRAILEDALRELCSEKAEIIIHECKLTKED